MSRRIRAAQAIAADDGGGQVDFDADEAMSPEGRQRDLMTEHAYRCSVVAAAQIYDGTRRQFAKIEVPTCSNRGTWSARFGASTSGAPRGDETIAGALEVTAGAVMKPEPDFLLPQPVEMFDEVLWTVFRGRGEDRRNPQGEAKARDQAECIRPIMSALEYGPVVELRVSRRAVLPPK